MKKQAVLVRIPGIHGYSPEHIMHMGQVIKTALEAQFPDKKIVVVIFNEDIHFLDSGEVRDLIDTLENITK